jgi:hypothetical protein
LIVLVQDDRALGLGWIEHIEVHDGSPKIIHCCPRCGRRRFSERKSRSPRYLCRGTDCGLEFDQPTEEEVRVTRFAAALANTVEPIDLPIITLPYQDNAKQNSIRPLHFAALEERLWMERDIADWYVETQGVARTYRDVGIAGFADRRARVDALDHEAMAAVIHGLLTHSKTISTDDEPSGPTVVAVQGPWGSGKSSLLHFISKRFAEPGREALGKARLTVAEAREVLRHPESVRPSAVRAEAGRWAPVWFNPWAHQSSEQLWAGLTRAILDAVDDRLHESVRERERYWLARNAARLDAGVIRRALRASARSPLLKLAIWSASIPLITRFMAIDKTVTFLGVPLYHASTFALVLPVLLLLTAAMHTAHRHFRGHAVHFLSPELLNGPVLSGALAKPGQDAGPVRDPLYRAKSGYLYLCQHDVKAVLRDANECGVGLIVFIDDLDRCGPQTTAEVLEAINLFLAEEFPHTRFVLALDPAVVAAQVDETYGALSSKGCLAHCDDPSPGWTFLRKLVQLPVALPAITDRGVDNLLRTELGTVADTSAPSVEADEPLLPEPQAEAPAVESPEPAAPRESPSDGLEHSPLVRDLLARRLRAQPNRSVREAKRLMTVWQYQVRLLALVDPLPPDADEQRACDLVLLAEIVTRWPALQRELAQRRDGEPGLVTLINAADDDTAWARAIRTLRIDRSRQPACDNLRELLRRDGMKRVGDLAGQLM